MIFKLQIERLSKDPNGVEYYKPETVVCETDSKGQIVITEPKGEKP